MNRLPKNSYRQPPDLKLSQVKCFALSLQTSEQKIFLKHHIIKS